MRHGGDPGGRHHARGPAQTLATRPSPSETRSNPLSDAAPFELGQRGQDVELQPTGRGRAIDALAEGDERHPQRLEVIEQRHKMAQIASQTVQTPTHDDIKPTAFVSK